jgi:acetolactate decarboxylase
MMNVMHKGELFGTIDLDTIAGREHLFGVGPLENLAGEITVLDGTSYISRVDSGTQITVERSFRVKAPFFVYASVGSWKERSLPRSIRTIPDLESFLDSITQKAPRPFAFRLAGRVEGATIHVVHLPPGSEVHSPDDAHKGEQSFSLRDRDADMVGFFSTQHQGVFTHHDTYVHIHLITTDKKMMGHLDEVEFATGGVKLYLPAD